MRLAIIIGFMILGDAVDPGQVYGNATAMILFIVVALATAGDMKEIFS